MKKISITIISNAYITAFLDMISDIKTQDGFLLTLLSYCKVYWWGLHFQE